MQHYAPKQMRRISREEVEIQPAQGTVPWGAQHVELSPSGKQRGTPGAVNGRGTVDGALVERRGSSPADMTAVSASTSSVAPQGASPAKHHRTPSDPTAAGGASPRQGAESLAAGNGARGRRGGGGGRKAFADRLQPPLPVSPRPAQLAQSPRPSQRAQSPVAAADTDPSAVFRSPVGERPQKGAAAVTRRAGGRDHRRRQGPPAYLRMDERPVSTDGKSNNGISQSQGIPLEADINLAGAASSSFYGSVDGIGLDSGGGHARRASEAAVQQKMAREYTASVAQEGVALAHHLGLTLQRCAPAAAPAVTVGKLHCCRRVCFVS